MRWGSVLIMLILLPVGMLVVSDGSDAEPCWIYATFEDAHGTGHSSDPVYPGQTLDADRLAWYESLAPWYHDEDDSPWDPHSVITGTIHIHNVYTPGPPDVHVIFKNSGVTVATFDLNTFTKIPASERGPLVGHTWISADDGTEWTTDTYWSAPGTFIYRMVPEPTPTPTPTPTPSGGGSGDDHTMQIAIILVASGAVVITALVLGYRFVHKR